VIKYLIKEIDNLDKLAVKKYWKMACRFTNKVVLVTGASSGIGAATANLLAGEGAHLILTGRNETNLEKVAENCYENTWNRPNTVPGDLNIEEDVERIVKTALACHGKLDVLINNAGIIELGSIETTSLEQFDRLINTNVRSMYHLTMLAVPHLIKTQGSIVNVSSVNGIRPFANVLAYNMSKSAVNKFTESVAMELASKKVRVNAVCPGVIITELQKRGGLSTEDYKKFLIRCQETHPLGRPGLAQEVAEAIAFLASDRSSFITGVTLPVDGGRHALSPR